MLGITTVSGAVEERAALADAVCRAAGRTDVPIVAGCREGILRGVVQPEAPQARGLDRFRHRPPVEFPPNNAIQFLTEQIHAHPGEMMLLAIGPMTNIGLLFAGEPELAGKLKQLVVMCGVFAGAPGLPPREWNALCDPIATAAVCHARITPHRSIGRDVTTQCTLPSAECIRKFRAVGGPLAVVAAMTEVWAAGRDRVTFHDPLAAELVASIGRLEMELEWHQQKLQPPAGERARHDRDRTSAVECPPPVRAVGIGPQQLLRRAGACTRRVTEWTWNAAWLATFGSTTSSGRIKRWRIGHLRRCASVEPTDGARSLTKRATRSGITRSSRC